MVTEDTLEIPQEDLISTQLALEQEMTERGAARYLSSVNKAQERGMEDKTDYGKVLLAGRLEVLADAIQTWKDEALSGRPGRRQTAVKLVADFSPKTLAYLTLKKVIEGLHSPRTLQFVAVSIGSAIEDEVRFAEIRQEEGKAYISLVQGAAKRVSNKHKHIYATRKAGAIKTWESWSRTDRLHLGVKMLEILVNTIGLVEIVTNHSSDKGLKYVKPLPDTLEWINKHTEATAILRPFMDPMVVPPRNWTTPWDGGYLSSYVKPLKLVKTRNRAYLQELENVDMPIVYDAINAIQRTPWQINSKVLEVMDAMWEQGNTVGGLPPKDGIPQPPKPYDIDTNEAASKEWRIKAAKAHYDNLTLIGTRIRVTTTLRMAKRYEKFRKIYFPYQLDFRGRIYAVTHLNPQGSDFEKALLRFSNGKPLGSEGWKWLAVHGANLAGYDKVSFEDRINWVQDNEDEILRISDDPYGNRGWCGVVGGVAIDKPWQFLAFCFEWAGFVRHGESYVSKLPVAMDGSCSGIQHFSAMLRDESGGKAVNLLPAEVPQDVYGLVAKKVLEKINRDVAEGTEDELRHWEDGTPYLREGTKALASQWLKFGVTRKTTKRSVMTLAYGSKEYGFKDQLMEDILTPAKRAATSADGKVDQDRFPFVNDGFHAAAYMAKLIWRSVNEVLVAAGEAMKWLQDAASLAAGEQLPVRWHTPVGFPVMQAYQSIEERRIKTAINGKAVFLTMKENKDKLDTRKQSQGISPNFVHSCDAAHLMLTVVRGEEQGIHNWAMIHDSFGTTAGDVEDLYRIVRESFVEMYTELDVLANFRDEIAAQLGEDNREKLPELPKKGTLDLSLVLESRYCFA